LATPRCGFGSLLPGGRWSVFSRTKPPAPVDVDQCIQAAAHQADLGAPIIASAPGGQLEVLFIDRRNNYVDYCIFKGHTLESSTGEGISGLRAPRDPDEIAYQPTFCTRDGHSASSSTFGRVGADVTAATFKFAHRRPVQGLVLDGFYEASWSSSADPDEITLTTKSGSTLNVTVPRPSSSDKCLNFTGL
jgi:hypothetical protein